MLKITHFSLANGKHRECLFYVNTIPVYVLVSHSIFILAKTSSTILQTRGRYKTLVQVPIIYASSGNWLPNLELSIIMNFMMICFSLVIICLSCRVRLRQMVASRQTLATILIYLWYDIAYLPEIFYLFMYNHFIYHFLDTACRDGRSNILSMLELTVG